MSSIDLLRTCVRALRRLTGAARVSLYLPAEAGTSYGAALIHDAELPAVPELADPSQARQILRLAAARLRSTAHRNGDPFLRQLDSEFEDGRLIRVSSPESLPALLYRLTHGERAPTRRATDIPGADPESMEAVWIGLAADPEDTEGLPPWVRLKQDFSWLTALASALAWHERQLAALLKDSISGLYGRSHFQMLLREALAPISGGKAPNDQTPVTVLLIDPDNFTVINESFGLKAGDAVLREIAQRLSATTRSKDLLARYSGAVFAVGLQGASAQIGELVARKAQKQLTEAPYRRGSARLSFSIGLAEHRPALGEDPGETSLELLRRADQALNVAREAGGSRIILWEKEMQPPSTGTIDRLNGIFTADLAKDYRNMLLLWDTVIVVSNTGDFEALASKLVERLHATFKADRVGLFGWSDDGKLQLIRGKARSATDDESEALELNEEQRDLLDEARTLGLAGQTGLMYSEAEGRSFCCVPLIAREQCLGALYVDGEQGVVTFDRSDSIFFRALAGQLAVTLDRARLADHERHYQEQEQRRLRSELQELRRALQHARLVYRSAELDSILTTLRRVAPSDATLLITGESGTGKELLARTAHELSTRNKKPLVVVDCSAIAASLIDRELFGHERGAFTGAEKPASGRLAEADGGTLLLDEIGELPLEVQSKLLRFTQEKMFTPVGGTHTRRVDVRIIAITNRNLDREVKAGRFRADLYYRLNVLHIEVPPLRKRPDDILFLARHFLEKFALQYQKGRLRLSPDIESWLEQYSWPGNVRELQNRIMQAVLLSESNEIGPCELRLEDASGQAPPNGATVSSGRGLLSVPADSPLSSEGESAPLPTGVGIPSEIGPDLGWSALADELSQQITSTLKAGATAPLGRWLTEDLILEAHAQARGVLSQGAQLLGIPESTFRRRFRRAQEEAGYTQRSPSWSTIRPLLAQLLRGHLQEAYDSIGPDPDECTDRDAEDNQASRGNVVERARDLLMAEISKLISPREVSTGAALMGVTQPTFRRWATKSSSGP